MGIDRSLRLWFLSAMTTAPAALGSPHVLRFAPIAPVAVSGHDHLRCCRRCGLRWCRCGPYRALATGLLGRRPLRADGGEARQGSAARTTRRDGGGGCAPDDGDAGHRVRRDDGVARSDDLRAPTTTRPPPGAAPPLQRPRRRHRCSPRRGGASSAYPRAECHGPSKPVRVGHSRRAAQLPHRRGRCPAPLDASSPTVAPDPRLLAEPSSAPAKPSTPPWAAAGGGGSPYGRCSASLSGVDAMVHGREGDPSARRESERGRKAAERARCEGAIANPVRCCNKRGRLFFFACHGRRFAIRQYLVTFGRFGCQACFLMSFRNLVTFGMIPPSGQALLGAAWLARAAQPRIRGLRSGREIPIALSPARAELASR